MKKIDGCRVVLASGSPRRRELLARLGIEFTVDTDFEVDETPAPGISGREQPLLLARRKAEAYCRQRCPDDNTIVVAADTMVVVDDIVLGKPHDAAEAREMLRRLSGREHSVVTGVCIAAGGEIITNREVTEVKFGTLTDEEINYYVDTYKPFDKAGAYGIQEWIGCIGIEGISGDYYNVVGLPVRLVYRMLREL